MAVRLTRALADAFGKPRRPLWEPTAAELEQVSSALRRPSSSFLLRPRQAVALQELAVCRGLFGILPVGTGKTAIAALAPRVLGAARPVFMCPAGARGSLEHEFKALHRELDFPWPEWLHYEDLSSEPGVLERLAPDALVADEMHALKHKDSGRTIRWLRFMEEHADVPFVGLTGTPTTDGALGEYAHLLIWALKEGAPVPLHYDTLRRLAGAVDRKPRERHSPGALLGWATPEQAARAARGGATATAVAREIWTARLVETPGVVVAEAPSTDQELTVRRARVTPPPEVAAALQGLEERWESPDGEPFSDALSLGRYGEQVSVGLYYQPVRRAPAEWAEARLAFAQACRRAIFSLRRGLATESEVREACAAGSLPREIIKAWEAWAAVEHTHKPRNRTVWLSDFAVQFAAKWVSNGSLIWVDNIALGSRLAEVLGLPYYRTRACDADGRHLKAHPAPAPAILSINSCRRSHNLQWANRNLFLGCVPCDQSLGRTHRSGQTRGVSADVFISSGFLDKALTRAQEQSKLSRVHGVPSVFGDLTIEG